MSRDQAPQNEEDGRLRTWGRFASVLLAFVGALGLLRAGSSGPSESVAVLIVHPASAMIYLVAGLAGIALVTTPAGRQIAGLVGGGGLALWGLLGLALRGSPNDVFTADSETVALHLVLGAAGIVLALRARRALALEARA